MAGRCRRRRRLGGLAGGGDVVARVGVEAGGGVSEPDGL